MKKTVIFKRLIYITLILLMPGSLGASEADSLFLSDELVKIELRSDFSAILKDRGEDPENHEAELIYKYKDRKTVKLPVKLMVRGNFRRNPENCNFPPLFVNFKKGDVANTLFENQNKLKLVTPCQSDEYVIEEHSIYKMYNEISDKSLKVRLVMIKYFDTSSNEILFERFSFFIEDKDRAAERNDAFVKDKYFTPFDLERDNFKKLSVFQYMIGNIDWFITSRKNIIIMQPNDTTLKPFAVPFDFDFSALINADYSKPRDQAHAFPSNRRKYKGLCYTENEFEEIFDFFLERRHKFTTILRKYRYVDIDSYYQTADFINEFYGTIRNKAAIRKEFIDVCETRALYNLPEI